MHLKGMDCRVRLDEHLAGASQLLSDIPYVAWSFHTIFGQEIAVRMTVKEVEVVFVDGRKSDSLDEVVDFEGQEYRVDLTCDLQLRASDEGVIAALEAELDSFLRSISAGLCSQQQDQYRN